MLRPRRNWTRGVAAQHASLSRWRSPVRIRSGPPSSAFPYAPSARPDGAFLCPASVPLGRRPIRATSVTLPPVKRTPRPDRARPAPRRRSWPCSPPVSSDSSVARRRPRSAGPSSGRSRPRRRRADRTPAGAGRRDSPSPTPTAAAVDARPARRARRRADRAGHELPGDATSATAKERRRRPGRDERPLRRRSRSSTGEADAILGALGVDRPSDPARLVLAADEPALAADLAKNRKRLAFLRADAVGPEVRALAWGDKALFGVDRVKNARRLAADRARCPAPAAAEAYDPATTWTLFAGGDILLDRGVYLTLKAKGADFAVRWRHGRHHRPLQGLLAARLGHCRTRSGPANAGAVRAPDQGRRHRRRQLREPGAEQAALPRLGDELLGRPALHRRPRRRRHRLRLAGQQPHPRRRRRRASCRRSRTSTKRGIAVLGRGQGPRRRAQAGHPRGGRHEGRDPRLRRDRRRLPRDRDEGRQRAACRPRPSRRTSPPRARPAPTSSSSTRTGAPSTTRRRSSTSRSWPR